MSYLGRGRTETTSVVLCVLIIFCSMMILSTEAAQDDDDTGSDEAFGTTEDTGLAEALGSTEDLGSNEPSGSDSNGNAGSDEASGSDEVLSTTENPSEEEEDEETSEDNFHSIGDELPLYEGDDVDELLSLCQNTTIGYTEDMEPLCINPSFQGDLEQDDPSCIKKCTQHRLARLRDAQNRTRMMIERLENYYHVAWQVFAFLLVLIPGTYLIYVGHFNWRTLPLIGNPFETDPTDGYRYSHYMWMQWVTLASNSPNYYRGMTPDTKELEYIPQIEEWRDPEADSDADLHPSWSIRDIYDMTADPDERLEFYFRRIQQKYQVSKQGRQNIKKFKQRKSR